MQRIRESLTLPDELAGRRFDQAAAVVLDEYSRSRLKVWIEAGQLTLDGRHAEPSTRIHGGEELLLDVEIEAVVPVAAEPIPLNVIHEDSAVFVIDKPAGLVVHPGAGNSTGTLQNGLLNLDADLAAVPRAGIVHRLDKDTSGLLVVARTLTAHAALAAQLEKREVYRSYLAICNGVLTGGGTIDAPVGRHPRDRLKMAVIERGREAVTHYRVLERFRAHTYIDVALETGRTHQIRVHMAHQRSPLVGDPLYGGRPRLPRSPTLEVKQRLQGFTRQALHAARLELIHPETKQKVRFESSLAKDMESLLSDLRTDAKQDKAE